MIINQPMVDRTLNELCLLGYDLHLGDAVLLTDDLLSLADGSDPRVFYDFTLVQPVSAQPFVQAWLDIEVNPYRGITVPEGSI